MSPRPVSANEVAAERAAEAAAIQRAARRREELQQRLQALRAEPSTDRSADLDPAGQTAKARWKERLAELRPELQGRARSGTEPNQKASQNLSFEQARGVGASRRAEADYGEAASHSARSEEPGTPPRGSRPGGAPGLGDETPAPGKMDAATRVRFQIQQRAERDAAALPRSELVRECRRKARSLRLKAELAAPGVQLIPARSVQADRRQERGATGAESAAARPPAEEDVARPGSKAREGILRDTRRERLDEEKRSSHPEATIEKKRQGPKVAPEGYAAAGKNSAADAKRSEASAEVLRGVRGEGPGWRTEAVAEKRRVPGSEKGTPLIRRKAKADEADAERLSIKQNSPTRRREQVPEATLPSGRRSSGSASRTLGNVARAKLGHAAVSRAVAGRSTFRTAGRTAAASSLGLPLDSSVGWSVFSSVAQPASVGMTTSAPQAANISAAGAPADVQAAAPSGPPSVPAPAPTTVATPTQTAGATVPSPSIIPIPRPTALPRLSTSGNFVIDDERKAVSLRGATVVGLDSLSAGDDLPTVLSLDEDNLSLMRDVWGLNLVRIPFQSSTILSGTQSAGGGVAAADLLAALDQAISVVSQAGLYVLLALTAQAGVASSAQGPAASPGDDAVNVWQTLAARYNGQNAVLYELYASPGPLDSSWPAVAQQLVGTIRRVNQASLIFVGGGLGGVDVSQLPLLFPTGDPVFNLVYTIYISSSTAPQPDDGSFGALAGAYPVFASGWTSTGAGDGGRQGAYVADLLGRYGIGWAAANWNAEPTLIVDAAGHDFTATAWGLVASRAAAAPVRQLLQAFSHAGSATNK